MYIKGIGFVPARVLESREIRDILLQLGPKNPETFIVILPDTHVFSDAISVEYLTHIEETKCDMEVLDIIRFLFDEGDIPSVFLNQERAENYGISLEPPDYAREFLKTLASIFPEARCVFLSPGEVDRLTLLRAGKLLRDSLESARRNGVILSFTDLPVLGESILNGLRFSDFLPVALSDVKPVNRNYYDSLLMGVGGTDELATRAIIIGEARPEAALLTLSDDAALKPVSLISSYREVLRNYHQNLIKSEKGIIKLVRKALELWIKSGERMDFRAYTEIEDPELYKRLELQRTGVFVTIFKLGKPRGAFGTVTPVMKNLGEEIINNSIEAATADPHFLPIRPEELDFLSFEVTVLDPPEMVTDGSQLDPEKYGLLIECGMKRGIVLPDLNGIETADEQLQLAEEQAGITEIDKEEPMFISRFTVERFQS